MYHFVYIHCLAFDDKISRDNVPILLAPSTTRNAHYFIRSIDYLLLEALLEVKMNGIHMPCVFINLV